MSIEVRSGDLAAFFAAPFGAYGRETHYVSPLRADLERFLDRARNPLFADPGSDLAFFTAHRDGRVLGRITAHVHAASNRLHGLNRGCFGYFDLAENPEVARALLGAAEEWVRRRGLGQIAGNFNLTAMQQMGVLTDGFGHAPYLDQIWSPPHVARLLQENGYRAEFGMQTAVVDVGTWRSVSSKPRMAEIEADPDFALLPVTRATVAERMEDARQILNASFAQNPLFVPLTADEFSFQAKDLKWILDPRLSMVLQWRGRPAAAVIVVPDVNPLLRAMRSRFGLLAPFHYIRHRLTNRRAVLIYAGVLPELQGRGLAPLLIAAALEAASRAGYHTVANTWIADVNGPSLAQMRKAGAEPLHRLHLFVKDL